MGAPIRIDFGTQSSPGRNGPDTGAVHINAYVEQVPEGQPQLPTYVPSGLSLFATVTDGGACRGGVVIGSNLFAVSGQKLVRIDLTGTVTDLAGIPGSTNVHMARNAKSGTPQIAIVLDGNKYALESSVLSEITDTDLPPPNSVLFLDQRVIYTLPDGRLFYSDIDNVSSIGALSFATAEGAPDGLVRGFAHKLDAWLFGGESTEVWRATSNTDNPFQRAGGGFIPKGCGAEHSVASIGEAIFWVGNDNIPYMATGYQLQPLNHPPVCRDLESITSRESIIGFTFADGGHEFYVLTCPSWTWQYNKTTGRWFQRKSYNSTNWIGQFAFRFGNKTIIGGASGGKFYEMSSDTYDEAGSPLIWTLRSPPLHAYPNRISVDRIHLDFITGVGLNSTDTDESEPVVGLRYSDDGGRSWSRQRLGSLGAQGQHQTRVTFNGLGTTGRQGRIWEIECAAPVVRGLRYAAIEGDQIGT